MTSQRAQAHPNGVDPSKMINPHRITSICSRIFCIFPLGFSGNLSLEVSFFQGNSANGGSNSRVLWIQGHELTPTAQRAPKRGPPSALWSPSACCLCPTSACAAPAKAGGSGHLCVFRVFTTSAPEKKERRSSFPLSGLRFVLAPVVQWHPSFFRGLLCSTRVPEQLNYPRTMRSPFISFPAARE